MVVPLDFTFTTTLMTPRTLRQVNNRVNRAVGEDYVIGKILRSKFTESIKHDIPHVYRNRSPRYERRKLRQVGHRTPWVFTGTAKRQIPLLARVTATHKGGRVYIKAPWSGKAKSKKGGKGFARQGFQAQQRFELEAIGSRQLQRMADYAAKLWQAELRNPQNLRKRTVRSTGIT